MISVKAQQIKQIETCVGLFVKCIYKMQAYTLW